MRDSESASLNRTGFWLMIALLALFAATKVIVYDTLDPDCFWHLRVADQLHRDGIGPIVDDLSFASNREAWTPYSWLAELGMKALWDHGGYRSAIAFTAFVEAGIIVLLAMCCLAAQRTPRYLATIICTATGLFLILPFLSFRPVTLAFFLMFAIAYLLLRDLRFGGPTPARRYSEEPAACGFADQHSPGFADQHASIRQAASGQDQLENHPPGGAPASSRLIWLIVPLTVLLTNIHLFSFFVPAMVLAFAIGAMLEGDMRRTRRYAALATVTALACLATPMLPGLIKTIFFYSAQDRMVAGPVIVEMQSIFRGPVGYATVGGLIAVLFCIGRQYRLVHAGQLICIVAASLLLLKLGRFAPIFALAACPALAATFPAVKDRLLGKRAIIGLLACVVLIGTGRMILAFPSPSTSISSWVNRHGPDTPGYPCAAADFIDRSIQNPTGHLINEFSWGGYLAWRLAGKYQVLLDGRTQVYPQKVWTATYLGSDADRRQFLAHIQADAALLPANKSCFRPTLIQLGWTSIYKDDRAEVLVPPSTVAHIE
jgi:hypothetical protein